MDVLDMELVARICPFGKAFVDIPLGDLDHSKSLSGPSQRVIRGSQVFPYGTTERFPNMIDSLGRVLSNSGHSYTECSSKGLCDRSKGVCSCFEGYYGSNCQKTSCPERNFQVCSGHGTCESASYLASLDADNTYRLWDEDMSRGCLCDPGFYGPSCNLKTCKLSYDPIYSKFEISHRYSNWSIVIATEGAPSPIIGNYSLVLFDVTGEDWQTEPITYGANCETLIRAIESLPNNAFPPNTIRCLMWNDYHSIPSSDEPIQFPFGINPYYGIKYTLAFPANPGILRPPELNLMLDGTRPSLYSTEKQSTLQYFIYPNGFHGEINDYFQQCLSVDVNLLVYQSGSVAYTYLSGLTSLETRLLRKCLGASNPYIPSFMLSGRVQGQDYQWEYGNLNNPHLIKLVDMTPQPVSDLCNPRTGSNAIINNSLSSTLPFSSIRGPNQRTRTCVDANKPPGFYALMVYDSTAKRFKIMSNIAADYSSTTNFAIFTTQGIVQLTSPYVQVFTNMKQPYSRTVYLSNASSYFSGYSGAIGCEHTQPGQFGSLSCLEKEDRVMIVDPFFSKAAFYSNPKYMNLYTVKKIYQARWNSLSPVWDQRVVLDMAINGQWHSSKALPLNTTRALMKDGSYSFSGRMYIFRPPPVDGVSGYQYVSECGNRGLCNPLTGLCNCFDGFSGEGCSIQTSLVVTRMN